jgi:hypothetical protein
MVSVSDLVKLVGVQFRTHAPGTITMVGLDITSEGKHTQRGDVYKKDSIRRLRKFRFPIVVLMLAVPVPAGCS